MAAAGYGEKRGVTRSVTIPLAFFSLMEFLQFAGYLYLNQCSLETNSFITQLSYLHIALQPIFVNMFFLTFLPISHQMRVRPYAYVGAAVVSALLLLKLVPVEAKYFCEAGQTLCGPAWCTISGNWHIGWSVPYYNLLPGDGMWYYALGTMILPALYGAWRPALTYLLTGPVVAYFLAGGNPHEWPAIWCFYAVIILIYSMKAAFFPSKSSPDERKRLFP